MDIAPITLDPDVAKVKAKRYARELRDARAKKLNAQYIRELTTLRRAYTELARGTKILDINKTFQVGGVNEFGQPKFAIARSSVAVVEFEWGVWTEQILFATEHSRHYSHHKRHRIFVDMQRRSGRNEWITGKSRVPTPPPGVVPEGVNLDNCHTLWEVTQWITKHVERDPYLLKHLGGPFFAVLAHWDLTELEASVQAYFRTV